MIVTVHSQISHVAREVLMVGNMCIGWEKRFREGEEHKEKLAHSKTPICCSKKEGREKLSRKGEGSKERLLTPELTGIFHAHPNAPNPVR